MRQKVTELENSKIWKQSKIWIPAAKFDEFCKQKFEKPGILFCAVFVGYLYINYSTELDAY